VNGAVAILTATPRSRLRGGKLVQHVGTPGKVAVTEHAIFVRLAPAANRSELDAIHHLLKHLNQRGLILPSDHKRLPLCFETQLR
jgi:hypothetical protein